MFVQLVNQTIINKVSHRIKDLAANSTAVSFPIPVLPPVIRITLASHLVDLL